MAAAAAPMAATVGSDSRSAAATRAEDGCSAIIVLKTVRRLADCESVLQTMTAESKTRLKLGYEDYKCFPDDGRRHEIIDGDHYMNPAPNTQHQRLSRRIQFQLYTQIELTGLGEIFDAPTDLQLSAHDIVQPDLIVVLRERQTIITHSRIHGIPDLVIEILSQRTADNDRVLKKNLYCRSQVPEYWIVDPEQQVVEQFVLRNAEYELLGCHNDRIELTILAEVSVHLHGIW